MPEFKKIASGLILLCLFTKLTAQDQKIVVHINESKQYQTIDNFAASDAWSCQFIGSWPEEKKSKIADWLFSSDTLQNGNPKGIGLSMWRYNLGAGSAEQNNDSKIKDEWRRAPLTINNNKKVQAQNWFLKAAKERGVKQFLGFYNSPPVTLTKNGHAFADSGRTNIDPVKYKSFAQYTAQAIKSIQQSTGVVFNYISPVNEPQWDWSDGGQEGCPYNNHEISGLVKTFSETFQQEKLPTKLLIAEAGQLNYLLPKSNKPDRDDQVNNFFNPTSSLYIGNLSAVSSTIASHSYFTTSPLAQAIQMRTSVTDKISQVKGLGFWQSEYCILGDNAGEINGDKKDLGINAGLYVAKVIYEDLAFANAAAWQWWTAISAYDYKDGLVYVDKSETDGSFSDSKMLWALGNYSRFIRPGMKRVEVAFPETKGVLITAFKDPDTKQIVSVLVNENAESKTISFDQTASTMGLILYTTSAADNLAKQIVTGKQFELPGKSVVTVLMK